MLSTDGRILSLSRLASALGAIGLLLAIVLFAQAHLLFSGDNEGTTPSAPRAPDLPELAATAPWPDATRITADGRSLFLSDIPIAPQTPAPVESPQPEQPPEQFDLLAVVIAPSGKSALLRSQQSQELAQVMEGAVVGSWNLAAVKENHVVLEHGGQQTILYLPDANPEIQSLSD